MYWYLMPEAIKPTENRRARDPMLVTGICGQTVLKEIRRITPIALHTTTLVETAIISDPLGSIPPACGKIKSTSDPMSARDLAAWEKVEQRQHQGHSSGKAPNVSLDHV